MIRFLILIVSVVTFLSSPAYSADALPANVFSELAKKVNPSVVAISVSINFRSQVPQGMYRDPFWDFFERFMQPDQMPNQEDPNNRRPVGTGFIIDSDGHIVTNFHVIEIADNVFVHLENDTETYEAKVIGGDKRTDIALLKIDTKKKLVAAPLGT